MRSAPRGQHSHEAPVALRIKSVELNRSPLWGLYHGQSRSCCVIRCCDASRAIASDGGVADAESSPADRGVICSLAREGGVRPQWAARAMTKMSGNAGGIRNCPGAGRVERVAAARAVVRRSSARVRRPDSMGVQRQQRRERRAQVRTAVCGKSPGSFRARGWPAVRSGGCA